MSVAEGSIGRWSVRHHEKPKII